LVVTIIATVSSTLKDASAFLEEVRYRRDFLASSMRPWRTSHLSEGVSEALRIRRGGGKREGGGKAYHGDSGAKSTPIMMGTGQIHYEAVGIISRG
jgi:hypothetical protein